MGSVVKLQSVKSFRSFKYNMKSITLASIVFTLSFCLNLVAGKNLPYKGSPSAGAKTTLGEVEDTEDNNGEDYRISPISTGVDYGDYRYTQKHYLEDKKRRMKKMKMKMKMWRKNKKNIKSF